MSSVRKVLYIGLTVFAVMVVFAFVVTSTNARGNTLRFMEQSFFVHDSTDVDTTNVNVDTTNTKIDTTIAKVDSAEIKKYKVKDSTYLQQLTYKRKDVETAQAFSSSLNPFYLKLPAIVFQSVQLDSTGKFVIVRQTVNGKDVRIPIKVPLEEYVRQRANADFEKNFSELVLKEESAKVSKKKDDLGDILGAFTKIDIPVPANPVFSIFGPPRINLNISGAVDIRAAFRNTTTDQQTTSAYGNTRNEPDFAQEVQINVSGTIGDKLNILADWNTQRTFEYENQLRIKYTGYEDEIVQSVEAGNVSLATSSSFVSSSSALFGIKTALQIGPLKLTAIASQKKGQIQEKTITGGAQESQFIKRAWEYSKDHFFIDTAYFSSYEPYIKTQSLNAAQSRLFIKANEYEVWLYNPANTAIELKHRANAFLNLPPVTVNSPDPYRNLRNPAITTSTDSINSIVAGKWDKLELNKDYVLHPYTGQLTMNPQVQDGQAIAISYRIENASASSDDDLIYGTPTKSELEKDTILVLKLVKPITYTPQDKVLLSMMLKNIYPLGGRRIQKDGFFLTMEYKESGKEAVDVIGKTKIIKLFGLDKNGESGNIPDDKFDFTQYTIDQERGEIIFPTLRPFTDGLRAGLLEFESLLPDTTYKKYIYDNLYDTTSTAAQNNIEKDKFVITGKSIASSKNTIDLGFNVVEGSVQVLLDGQVLTPNVDYTVDYIIGQVLIRKQEALIPGKNLQVKFEQNDLFQLASKTLMGLRGEVDVSEKTKFGFTVMNLDQQVLSDKVRLNEEPSNNTIYGFDGQTSGELPFLTKAIDALPFLDTKAKSEFTLRGEAAYMSPDPNTKKSTIADDNGKGIAYIDDFEGAKRVIPIGVGYGQWHDISAPKYQFNIDTSLLVPDTIKINSKAKAYWFNEPNGILVDAIYGVGADGKSIKQVGRGQDRIQALTLNYNPKKRGAYNFSPNLDSTLRLEPKKNWAGIQKLVSLSAINLVQENVGFIEIWVRVLKGSIDSTRKVFIDLGTISEDIIPNGVWDTEDQGTFKNDILNPREDTGLDGIFNDKEQSQYSSFIEANKLVFPEIVNDPSGDDYNYNDKNNFQSINLTEGNANSEIGRFPDSEDLNRNSIADRTNNYYEYELNLDTTDAKNSLKVGGGANGWFQYRIPIKAFKNEIGSPDQTNIQYARVWLTGHPEEFEMQFVEFNLIGNQWEEAKKDDPTFKVSVVNVEDNSLQGYKSPPGVFRERDRTKPDEQVYGNEQSLALNFFDLPDGKNREAIKKYAYRPLDVFSYREMKMFVHGSENLKPTADKASVKMYIRFGSDSLNYYEYKAPVYPGWDIRNNVTIRFEDITSLKQGRKNENARTEGSVPGGPDSSVYAVLGNPTLTRITFISVGVENPVINGTEQKVTGQVWVNELRLSDVDDTPGWAYSMSSTVKLADLGSVAFTYSQVDPFFHSLESRFGSRVTNKNWNVSTAIALDRFFPQEWSGTQLPFSYSHSEQLSTPLYKPSSDVLVSKAADQQRDIIRDSTNSAARGEQEKERILMEAQTLSTTDTYAVPSFKLNVPSNNWFFRDIFNRIGYGFSYTTSSMRNPTIASRTSWQWNANIAYAYSFSPANYVQPFGFFENLFFLEEFRQLQLYYIPISNITTGFSIARNRANERLRNQEKDSPTIRGLSSSRNFSFAWKLTENGLLNLSGDYALAVSSSMVHLELDRYGRQRDFQQILNQIFLQDQFINFGFDNSYNQSVTVNTRPRVPAIFDLNKYITLTARYNVGYRWNNSLQQGAFGISTGWGNSITFSSDVSLKSFVETWFPAQSVTNDAATPVPGTSRRSGDRDEDGMENDKAIQPPAAESADTVSVVKKSPGEGLIGFARILIKTPLLDYDKININFTQSNNANSNGVPGRPGFTNFFGRVPFIQQSERAFGPTRAYQLGLVSSPGASITDVFLKPQFPFIGFETDAYKEIRARGARLTDGFSQNNKLSFRTTRDLWTGARIDLNWNLGWNYSRNTTLEIDSATGFAKSRTIATGGSIERSFLTLPPVFIFSMFKSGIEQVGKLYTESYVENAPNQDQKLAKAFEDGFESFPFLKKLFGEYFPRVNYSFRWDGLEQMSLFKNFATRVSLDHAYQSNYSRTFIGSLGGGEVTQSQRISYAFAPLAGLSVSFKEVLKGTMSANVRYGSNVTYDLSPSSKNIVESVGNDMSITGSFAKSGFEIPLFGLSLQNDIDISFTYSLAHNSRTTYDAKGKTFNTKGTPGEGSTRTQMEPRIRYVLSARVTASLFYRYTKIAPDEGGSRIPGSSTNEGGFDVHIAIQ